MKAARLLLIDDEPTILRVLSMSLRADGYEVVTASSGEDGLAAFDAGPPEIVLTDIKMPGMDGLEVLKRVKEKDPYPEVIIITGHGDIDAAIEALKYGASDFINKPIRDDVLKVALERAQQKLRTKDQLLAYTQNLEKMVQAATLEIKRKSRFQEKLIKSSHEGIVATDHDWKIVIYNPGAEKIFGLPPGEVVGRRRAVDLYPQKLSDALREKSRDRRESQELHWREIDVVSPTGQPIPTRCAGTLLYEKGELMGSVVFFQDLRKIKRLEQELIQSERLAATGQTVAGMAHGIKNILHGFKGGSYLITVGLDKGNMDKIRTGWRMIQKNIDRTSRLVLDLLSFAKERKPELQKCSPNAIVEDVLEVLKETAAEHDIAIQEDLAPDIDEGFLDPDTLHTVLLNLVSNAIDACLFDQHSKPSYRIAIRTSLEGGQTLRISVEDNGAGMRDEVLNKLFTSFFSTKGVKGTGLGLLVTQKLVQEHGGAIDVDSRWGEGTKFTVSFPFQPAVQ